jgi:hypothetical protein
MAHKNHYKKIFVTAAALFILFAPVGMTSGGMIVGTAHSLNQAMFSPLNHSTLPISFRLNLALATTTTTGVGAGTTPTQNPDLFSCAAVGVTCAVYYVALTINGAMAMLLMIFGYVIRLALQFNNNIFNSPAVQTGFSVTLAIANLGFVLGIIIIAIATIIRNQTYGIKQLLWKLVVMAVLVNFGLVITAPIVGFANSMSNYFINATSPSASTGGYEGYLSTLLTAFSPQTLVIGNSDGSGSSNSSVCNGTWSHFVPYLNTYCAAKWVQGTFTDPNNHFWQTTMALIFSVVFSALTVFVFLCLAVLLIIRYLMLGGLLIVLPLAWLTFVFPKFDNSYSKWWNTFIKWTFFPPLALFFIYLAFITATNTGNNTYLQSAITFTPTSATGVEGALTTQTGLNGDVLAQTADEILLVGLTIMGLMFALSLSGKAGSTVVNGATAVTKAAGGYVGRKTGKGAARVYQKAGGGDLNKWMQERRIPGVSAIGRGMANLTESATKNQVDARHKALGLGAMDDDRLQAVTQGLHGKEDQLAAVQEWQKRGKVDKIEKIGGDNFADWLKKNQGTFKDYGRGKLSGDIDTAMESNDKIRKIAEVTGGARSTISTEEIEKITNSARVVDKNGIMGAAGATVSAKDLAKTGKDETAFKDAQTVIDNPKSNKKDIANAKAHIKQFQDAAGDADQAIADAINKKVDEVDVVDKENLLGRGAGKPAKAGEFRDLMQKESETFWEGKDKSDASKGKSSAIFGDKPKFGLSKEALNEIGRSVAHGIATQMPTAMGSIAGKLDNSKQLETFTSVYRTSIEDAKKSGKINERRAKELNNALKKVLAGKLAYMGVGEPGATPAPTPTPNP